MFPRTQALSHTISIVLLLGGSAAGYADEIAHPETPPKFVTLETMAEQVKTLIESKGYTDVKVAVVGNAIAGTATKDGRQVTILFDDKGVLRIE